MGAVPYVKVAIAGGGTGGHLFPAIAVAEELKRQVKEWEILFVVGKRGRGAEILRRTGYEPAVLNIEGLKGRGILKAIKVMGLLPKSIAQAKGILKSFSPHVILGVGGYSAGPLCLAGRFLNIPTAIHEQNAFPGLTNRMLARIVDRIFISFEHTREYLKGPEPILTGTPVRQEFFQLGNQTINKESRFTILVTGGSQGARAINQAVVDALCILRDKDRKVNVIHQTGELDYENTLRQYQEKNLKGEVFDFIGDMASAYAKASMVISRAGASTIFELAAMGKPSILIPYPYATNRHQEINAGAMADMGGAEVVLQDGLSGEKLAQLIIKYMDHPSALEQMAQNAKKLARPDAAKVIVENLLELVAA